LPWKRLRLVIALAIIAVALLFWPALSALIPPRPADLHPAAFHVPRAGHQESKPWVTYRGAEDGAQYSDIAQITPANVNRLQLAWTHHSGDIGDIRDGTAGAYEATPIIANAMLYFCNPTGRVFALDPVNGTERWSVNVHNLTRVHPRREICRGVTYWEDAAARPHTPCAKRLFIGDAYGQLSAIDADTGALCTEFGGKGFVELNSLDYHGRGAVYLTSPPTRFQDSLIVGCAIDDNERTNAPHGIVRALDARTGRILWSFDPIPDALGNGTGAANVWAGVTVDSEHAIVYLPTSSPSTDSFGGNRVGDIPLANALVALNATTGAILWHFQTVHHDLFDYDLPTQPAIFNLRRGAEVLPAIAQVTKTGFVYVLNRLTGESMFPIEERVVPVSEVPGETTSPTQPFPKLPEAAARQHITRDDLFGLTWFDRAACRSTFDRARYDGLFTPPSIRGSLEFPSAAGGANWGSAALDTENQILVIRTQNIGSIVKLTPATAGLDRDANVSGSDRPLWGTPYVQKNGYFISPLGIPCTPPPWGQLTAVDTVTGKTLWQVPLGQFRWGSLRLPQRWGSPGEGGPMITAGGLVFVGATLDPKLRAFDITNGKVLWDVTLPAPAVTVPMSYRIADRQFIVVAAGGSAFAGTELSDAVVAYALPPH
jgi:quinoprotein glucose dehydrogenase